MVKTHVFKSRPWASGLITGMWRACKLSLPSLQLEKAEQMKIRTSIAFIGELRWQANCLPNLGRGRHIHVWITINWGKLWKRWEYQTTWPASWETCMQVRKQQLELDMEQETGSKQEKEYIKAVYCHPACLTYMQSTSWGMLGWMKHKLESKLLGEISITHICRWHHPYGRKWRGTKKPLDEIERGEWKSWLKAQHSEN